MENQQKHGRIEKKKKKRDGREKTMWIQGSFQKKLGAESSQCPKKTCENGRSRGADVTLFVPEKKGGKVFTEKW